MKKAGFKKYDSAYKRTESPFTKYASDAQRKAIWASKNEKKSAMKKVEKMSPEDFASAFGKSSMIGAREQSLEERETRVNDIFSDRSNVRDLLVSPDAPKGGVRR